nr:immunoglobulin heavy chain junction region [Mus musculus]
CARRYGGRYFDVW